MIPMTQKKLDRKSVIKMKIPQLFEQKKPVFSLEIFPPKKKANLETIYDTVEKLAVCEPDFISVTYGAGGNLADNATCDIASNIKKNYGIEAVAHLTCVNSSREDVKEMIERFHNADIENVLALRGDIVPDQPMKNDFAHANELAIEIQRKCSDDLEILGACYPEGHYESRSLDEDIHNLKYKIGAGVKVLITQLFFDNKLFYEFVGKARMMGVNIPISAGIMPIVNSRQIERTVALSGASLPPEFTKMISAYEHDAEGLFEAGIQYAVDQIRDLITNGVDGIHLYTMNNPQVALRVHEAIKDLLP